MSRMDEYMRHHYLIIDGEDFTAYACPAHQVFYDGIDSKLKAYAKEQLEAGAKLCTHSFSPKFINLICPAKAKDGQTCYIIQGLYGDPRDNTFIICSAKGGGIYAIDRTRQCSGLDITDIGTIMKRALVCGDCGKPVDSFEELNFVLYDEMECDECFKSCAQYITKQKTR